jgi:hypothetical protein
VRLLSIAKIKAKSPCSEVFADAKVKLLCSEVFTGVKVKLLCSEVFTDVKDSCFYEKREKIRFVGEVVRKNSENGIKMVAQFLDKHNINSVYYMHWMRILHFIRIYFRPLGV